MELIILETKVDLFCFAYGPRATAMKKKTEEVLFIRQSVSEMKCFLDCLKTIFNDEDTKANGLRINRKKRSYRKFLFIN